jgi:hypothetical protein
MPARWAIRSPASTAPSRRSTPLFPAVYYTGRDAPMKARDAIHAEVGRTIAQAFAAI